MKKILIALIALCLFALPVMAQTQDNPQEITWEELEESFAETGYDYDFWDIPSLGISMMIPAGLEPMELSEDHIDNGFVEIFATEDQSVAVLLSFRDLECETLADVEQLVIENIESAQILGYYVINGLDALMFLNPGNEDLTVAMGTVDPGYFIQVSIKPITNEEINKLSGFIFGSIMAMEEE